jgi:hypothetical protein
VKDRDVARNTTQHLTMCGGDNHGRTTGSLDNVQLQRNLQSEADAVVNLRRRHVQDALKMNLWNSSSRLRLSAIESRQYHDVDIRVSAMFQASLITLLIPTITA